MQALTTYWYVTGVLCLLPAFVMAWHRWRGSSVVHLPRATLYALVLPLGVSLVVAIAATDLDLRFDWVVPASFWVFGTLLLLSLAGIVTVLVRLRSGRSSVLAVTPLLLWLAVCVNGAGVIAVSGFGRHWR